MIWGTAGCAIRIKGIIRYMPNWDQAPKPEKNTEQQENALKEFQMKLIELFCKREGMTPDGLIRGGDYMFDIPTLTQDEKLQIMQLFFDMWLACGDDGLVMSPGVDIRGGVMDESNYKELSENKKTSYEGGDSKMWTNTRQYVVNYLQDLHDFASK